jgi:hypothetical protein
VHRQALRKITKTNVDNNHLVAKKRMIEIG